MWKFVMWRVILVLIPRFDLNELIFMVTSNFMRNLIQVFLVSNSYFKGKIIQYSREKKNCIRILGETTSNLLLWLTLTLNFDKVNKRSSFSLKMLLQYYVNFSLYLFQIALFVINFYNFDKFWCLNEVLQTTCEGVYLL